MDFAFGSLTDQDVKHVFCHSSLEDMDKNGGVLFKIVVNWGIFSTFAEHLIPSQVILSSDGRVGFDGISKTVERMLFQKVLQAMSTQLKNFFLQYAKEASVSFANGMQSELQRQFEEFDNVYKAHG